MVMSGLDNPDNIARYETFTVAMKSLNFLDAEITFDFAIQIFDNGDSSTCTMTLPSVLQSNISGPVTLTYQYQSTNLDVVIAFDTADNGSCGFTSDITSF